MLNAAAAAAAATAVAAALLEYYYCRAAAASLWRVRPTYLYIYIWIPKAGCAVFKK